MNIFGFRPFKGRFNLGNADDIPNNQDGTLIGSIKQINNDLSVFSFRDNEGQAQYSMDNGETWVDFKNPAGTLSITANGTFNVADYASAEVKVQPSVAYAATSGMYSGGSFTPISANIGGPGTYLICIVAWNSAQDANTNATINSAPGTLTEIRNSFQYVGGNGVRIHTYKLIATSAGAITGTVRYAGYFDVFKL